ncbi:DNA double-strand break repair Rad50 ATPase, putative [Entamoeba dispar SAW760]|uniref:DNA double-strand break repair Rad50 ATPase, putative n=1 Tax=Entamoeba dispar (strain ATCC PRA-260 / SAW760) TaxID=370354 RepID=B0EB83_ENTDS|nr:DNA double-strand break repair Rad50 ATPase, putative [Entamoeba dispar SAW760]EDR28231.1 DNA double-strand break repair Rad50 ATPase, putative [Entamoeba dispar SAW760]|eukprot:EDR28231.1 DNA double-strand break repair Rad50 ATPase, putative [Entamoeba dispar SAW760]
MIIDIGGEKTKLGTYGEVVNSFRVIESKQGKQEIPSVIALNDQGDIQFGENGERVMGNKGYVSIKYPMLINSITQKLNEQHKSKRFEWIFRDGDGISVLEDEPLKIKIGGITASYGFLISAYIDELIDHIDIKEGNIKTDYPSVFSIPSFFNNKQLDILYNSMTALTTEVDDQQDAVVGDDIPKDDIKDIDGEIQELQNEVSQLDDDKFIQQKKESKKKNNKKTIKTNKKKNKKRVKGLKKSKENEEEFQLEDNQEEEFQLEDDINTLKDEELKEDTDNNFEPVENKLFKRLKETTLFASNHVIHALAYYSTENNEIINPANKPIIVIEFGASYCRATKFIIKGKKTIKILQHEVDFNINTRKLNHNVFLMVLKKFVNTEEIVNKIKNMAPHQLAELWKSIDEMRIKLSANEQLITEFMNQKIILEQNEFNLLLREELHELTQMLLSMKSKDRDDLVYLTGGLSYTPILKEKVKDIFGTYSSKIGSKQMLEGMKFENEYDSDNCFDMYEVEGKVHIKVVSLSEGFIESIVASGGIKRVNKEREDLISLIRKRRTNNEIVQKQIMKKVEYQTLLMTYRDNKVCKKDKAFMEFIYSELDLLDNEKLYPLDEIETKIKEAKRLYDELLHGDPNKETIDQDLKEDEEEENKKKEKFINDEIKSNKEELNQKNIENEGDDDDNEIEEKQEKDTTKKKRPNDEEKERLRKIKEEWKKHLNDKDNLKQQQKNPKKDEEEKLFITAKDALNNLKDKVNKKGIQDNTLNDLFNKIEKKINDKTLTNNEFLEYFETIKKQLTIDSTKQSLLSSYFIKSIVVLLCCVFVGIIILFFIKSKRKSTEVELEDIRER